MVVIAWRALTDGCCHSSAVVEQPLPALSSERCVSLIVMSAPSAPRLRSAAVISDARFRHVHHDPRFVRPASSASSAFTVDRRFERMFSDPAFKLDYAVDRWGRAVGRKGEDDIKKFYRIQDDGRQQDETKAEEAAEAEQDEGEAAQTSRTSRVKKDRKSRARAAEPREQRAEADGLQAEPQSSQTRRKSSKHGGQQQKRTLATPAEEAEETEEAEPAEAADDGDDFSQSFLSSRNVAPPSSDSESEASSPPSSPTFPNVLGSDSDSDELLPHDEAQQLLEEEEEVPMGEASSSRLAAVNLDWDKLRALDLLLLFRSFLPADGGSVLGVVVYRSEFGKQRLQEEERYGPVGLYGSEQQDEYRSRIERMAKEQEEKEQRDEEQQQQSDAEPEQQEADDQPAVGDADIEQADEEEKEEEEKEQEEEEDAADHAVPSVGTTEDGDAALDPEKLRAYELSRLRYHYAIVTCSSASTAQHLYSELDGSELESTANKLDLRFVPDSAAFAAEDERDRAEEAELGQAALAEYRPPLFVTKALQHSRVELSWDADDEGRKKLRKAKWKGAEDEEDDLKVYLASDDEEGDGYGSDAVIELKQEEQEEEKPVLKRKARARYSGLLDLLKRGGGGGDGQAAGGEGEEEQVIEMTFEPGLKAKGEELLRRVAEKEERKTETVFERRERESRERRRQKKKDRKLQLQQGGAAGPQQDEDEDDELSVDEDDEFFKGAFDDDEYLPAKQRAKAFFGDDQPRGRREEGEDGKGRDGAEAAEEKTAKEVAEEERRKAELELLLLADRPSSAGKAALDADSGYNLKQLIAQHKGKKKSRKEASASAAVSSPSSSSWQLDTADARFSAIYDRPEFSIDPTHPEYRPTREMDRVMQERSRRREEERESKEAEVRSRKQERRKREEEQAAGQRQTTATTAQDAGLQQLVQSVKLKAQTREQEAAGHRRRQQEQQAQQSVAGKRVGQQSLTQLNKRQKLKGDMRT